MRRITVIVGAAVLAVAAGGATLAASALAATPPPYRDTSVPANGATAVSLQVEGGTTRLAVRAANLGGPHGTLLRATTPGSAQPGIQVRPARPGKPEAVRLTLNAGGNRGDSGSGDSSAGSPPGTVTIALNSAVTWWLDLAGGTRQTIVDLRAGHVEALAFTAGSQVIDASLPSPSGTLPIVMTGGASQLLLHLPRAVPVRLTASGGAGSISLDGSADSGVGGGSVFESPGWNAARARFEVDATAGAASISIGRIR